MNGGECGLSSAYSPSGTDWAVVFVGKLIGAMLFEPVIERVGCKKTLYIGSSIQIIGIVRTSLPSLLTPPGPGLTTDSGAIGEGMDPILDRPSTHLPRRRTGRHHRAHLRSRVGPGAPTWLFRRQRPGLRAHRGDLGILDESRVRERNGQGGMDGPRRSPDDRKSDPSFPPL